MGARELLHELADAGFTVEAEGDKLVIRPASKLTDDQRAAVRAAKPDLLALLAEPEPTATAATAAPVDAPGDWRALHDAFMAHHWRCVHCIAAGRMPGRFDRCPTGRLLWASYTDSTTTKGNHP
jgi:virulence-associated protein VagC